MKMVKTFLKSFFSKDSVKAWAGMAGALAAGYVVQGIAWVVGFVPFELTTVLPPDWAANVTVWVTTAVQTFFVGLSVWWFANK